MKAATGKTVHLRINSPGGDVFEARAMVAAIKDARRNGQTVIAHVDGLAASAASYIMLAADRVEIEAGAFVMIHNAWGFSIGNAEEHRATAAILEKVDGSLVADYVAKTGQSEEQIREWMAAETWFTSAEAVEHGFADAVHGEETEEEGAEEEPKEEEEIDASARWNLGVFKNAPVAARTVKRGAPVAAKKGSTAADLHEENARRLQMLSITGSR